MSTDENGTLVFFLTKYSFYTSIGFCANGSIQTLNKINQSLEYLINFIHQYISLEAVISIKDICDLPYSGQIGRKV